MQDSSCEKQVISILAEVQRLRQVISRLQKHFSSRSSFLHRQSIKLRLETGVQKKMEPFLSLPSSRFASPKRYVSLSPKLYPPCQGISISFYPSVYLLFWNSYLQSIPTFSNICIFLSPRLFLHPVKSISFYHCEKNLDHIVFPFRSFV